MDLPGSLVDPVPAHCHDTASLFAGSGEMESLMRRKCWADTSLGSPNSWPQSLRAVVRILLTSRYAMWMGWGDDLTFFYNNAYRPTLGIKHAWALGASAREVWKEIWPDIGPRIEHVLNSGEATWDEGLQLFLERRGYAEETYHTFSYSPLADDGGQIVGMLCVVSEETERIIGVRRLACLNGLASDIAGTNARDEVLAASERQFGAASRDLPFTLTYLFDASGCASLGCATGVPPNHPIAPASIDPADPDQPWPAHQMLRGRTVQRVSPLTQRFGHLPTGPWDKPPRDAIVAPIAGQGSDVPRGFLVAAVSPYRPSADDDQRFVSLLAGQLAAGLANADAYDAARRRAEALAEINHAKTTFFSNISHEFRTPLTLMLGPLEELMARHGRVEDLESQSLVKTTHRNATRLLKLVNSLLDFSRIEAGRMRARYEAVDLAAFTAEIASSFRSACDQAGLRLIIDCRPLPHPVHVDRDLWEKIVLNLLSNAFKFTLEGEIGVSIGCTADAAAAELIVRDTGTGIPAHELPRLFDRFHRVEGARGRSFEGSGIGLALVLELTKLHGATVAVTSEPGRGSRFTVTVPFGTAHLGPERVVSVPGGPPDTGQTRAYGEEAIHWLHDRRDENAAMLTSGAASDVSTTGPASAVAAGRVLLVEDNVDMRDYVRRLLTEHGHAVEAVENGRAALLAARRRRPELILSDVMMPELDGFGLLRALRQDDTLCDVPVVLLSARAGEEARVDGLDRGADDYLTKPFTARELLARVDANLRMAQTRREAIEALRTRTMELETVLATVPAAVWSTHDTAGRFVHGNRQANAWLRIADHANASLASPDGPQRFRVFRDGLEVAPEHLAIRRAASGEEVRDDEVEIRFEVGGPMTLLINASPLRDAAGQVVGAVAAGIDISSRRRQEKRLRCVIESAPNALLMINRSGRIVMANAQAERLFGYTRDDLLGQSVEILLPMRFRDKHPALRAGFFVAPLSRPMGAGRDLFGLRKDGSEVPIEIGLSPVETDDGDAVLAAIIDLTERVRAAEALAESEAEFRASFEGAAVGKVLADPDSRGIMRANRALAQMLGVQPDDMVGRGFADFIWHEDVPADAADYARLQSGEIDATVREIRVRLRDGSPLWVRSSATIVRAAGRCKRAIVVLAIEDIDTRHKAEAALRAAKLQLEQVLTERTDALDQRDLLLREVYHRVKNNLQLVDSLLMMQSRKLEQRPAREALLSLRGRIFALGLVHQQLMGSADLKTFDVVPFLEDLSKNIMESGAMAGVTISVHACSLEIGLDLGVPLGLLVTELVTNSLKHAFPSGSGTVSIVLRNDIGDDLTLTVSDDGVGQGRGGAEDDPPSGLGTRIIRRLVEQLEGSMVVDSRDGTVTEIRIGRRALS